MKKNIGATLLSLGGLLLVSCSSSIETPKNVTSKDIDVYETSEVATSVKCYFLDDIDTPYINIRDLVSYRMSKPFENGFPIPDYSYSYSDGLLECKNAYNGDSYSLYIDGNKDEIRSNFFEESIDLFHYGVPLDLLAADRSPIAKPVDTPKPVENDVTLSLSEYHIDLVTSKDTVLIPFAIANSLFFNVGEKNFTYSGKAIYESNSLSYSNVNASYFSYSNEEKNAPRNEDSATFNRNVTFFLLNTFFGRKDEAVFTDFRDYAKSLGVYDDLASTDPLTSCEALAYLIEAIDDLHSAFRSPSPKIGKMGGTDEKDVTTTNGIIKARSKGAGFRKNNYYTKHNYLNEARKTALGDGDLTGFHYYGDTCIIRFDGFTRLSNDLVFSSNGTVTSQPYKNNTFNLFYDAFKDLKNHPEITKIAIDESINGGGDVTTLIELAGFFMPEIHTNMKNKLTGIVRNISYKVDTNYDGQYDENDYPGVNYDIYCLVSNVSFSCGNLFPFILQENKAASIVGETTGGGSCAVMPMISPEGDSFQISGMYEDGTLTSDNAFVSSDSGIHPDITISPTNFYTDATLVASLE